MVNGVGVRRQCCIDRSSTPAIHAGRPLSGIHPQGLTPTSKAHNTVTEKVLIRAAVFGTTQHPAPR